MSELSEVLNYAAAREWGQYTRGVPPMHSWEGPAQPHISVIAGRHTKHERWIFIPATWDAVRKFEAEQ